MLKSGKDYLEGLRDGRVVYIGRERVDDVTRHPAFRNAAQSIADLYDMKADPAHRDLMTFEEDGERYSSYYLKARSRDDLVRRTDTHRRIAQMSYGLLGRSPDYIASFVTGMNLKADIFGPYAENVRRYYDFMRRRDIYAAHAVVPPQASRDPAFYLRQNMQAPGCRVVREDDDGVVVTGIKMLATGSVISDEIWVGNIIPLAPEHKAEAITFAVPCSTPGLTLWSRKPFEPLASSEFDRPLTWRFDETDAMVHFDEVKVPWERVFVHNDTQLSRGLYIETAAHSYGNHQSNVRFLAKLQLLVGLASRIAQANGADQIPAVRETLGRLAAIEGLLEGVIAGQIHAAEEWPTPGYFTYNRRMMYAALNWAAESYSSIVDTVRELCGGGVLQMPADASVLEDAGLGATFRTFWDTPQLDAVSRLKLFKLAWDIIGSDFAGRHLQYEKFFAGASFIVRNHSYREAPWGEWQAIVDGILARMQPPEATPLPEAAE